MIASVSDVIYTRMAASLDLITFQVITMTLVQIRPLCVASLLLVVFAAPGCSYLKPSDRSVVDKAEGFDQGLRPAEIKQPEVDAYFQKIGARIVAAAQQSDRDHWGPPAHFDAKEDETWMFKGIQFHLVNSKTLNAFTTGGEHVYIYNELLQMCHNEDELAAVMSHEFGHVYSRHVQKGTTRQYGMLAAALGVGAAGYVAGGQEHGKEYAAGGAALGMLAANFAGMKFTRTDEAEADTCGFHFYCLAGWDPNKFGDFFQTMIDKGYDKTPAMMSDHPSLASRVKIARERAKTLPDLPQAAQLRRPETASGGQFEGYKAAAQRAAASTPDDRSLAQTQKLLMAIPRSCLTPVDQPDQEKARQELMQDLKQQGGRPAPVN